MFKQRVAFLGCGAMGGGMARVLIKAGYTVKCFDVYRPLVDKITEEGGKAAASPADAARISDVVVIMVVGPPHVNSVLFNKDTGAVHGLKENAIVVITSTVPPGFTGEVQNRICSEFGRKDVVLLDCPVSGGTTGAANGTLTIFSSGSDEGLDRAQPVLSTLATKLHKIPGGLGFGSRAKMCHQILAEVEIALSNEGMAFAARAGLNTQEAFDAVQNSDGWSWINGNRIPHMLQGDKRVYSSLPNSLKDTSIIVDFSRVVSYPVFMSSAAEQVFEAGIYAGWAKEDDSTLWRLYLSHYPEDTIYQMTKPGCNIFSHQEGFSVQDVIDIFAGAHLALSLETIGLSQASGLDTQVMYKIFSNAAGSCTQWIDHVPKMKGPKWDLRDVPEAKEILRRLESAMVKANAIGSVMPIAAAALQILKRSLQ